jgi:hypothetical protein
MVNMLFWFIMKPTGIEDPVKTIVTSMAAVLTTSMSLRIVLSVRGSLEHGGSFALSGSSHTGSSRTTHVLSTRSGGIPTNITTSHGPTYTLDDMRSKPEGDWVDKSSVMEAEAKPGILEPHINHDDERSQNLGVKVTINRETGYDVYNRNNQK